jgi:hypothetical protein
LRDPVEQGIESGCLARHPEADGDCGIEVAAGNVPERADHDRDRQTESERDSQKAQAA